MGAAAWTHDAVDITERLAEVDEGGQSILSQYLTIQQLSDAVGLAEFTIRDTLARHPLDHDPQVAIYRPAARTGGGKSGLGATPLWTPEQRDYYIELKTARDKHMRTERKRKSATGGPDGGPGLPVYNAAEAAERGLVTTEELADITGYAENALRRLYKHHENTFPPEVGIAARVPPYHMGPPRTLRNANAVLRWLQGYSPEQVTDPAVEEAAHDGASSAA